MQRWSKAVTAATSLSSSSKNIKSTTSSAALVRAKSVTAASSPAPSLHFTQQRKQLSTVAAAAPSLLRPSSSTLPRKTLPATATAKMLALTKFRPTSSQPTQPRTLEYQPTLPRLPIPPLEQTLSKYLKSIEPVLLQMQEKGEIQSAKQELEKRRLWAQELIKDGSLGQRLQHRLQDVDATTPHNWLDDRYWLQKAYHEWRVPLLINSNWWLLFTNDPQIQSGIDPLGSNANWSENSTARSSFKAIREKAGRDEKWDVSDLLGPRELESMDVGIRRAAWLLWRFVEFKIRLDKQNVLPDSSRAGPFCMHQYTNVFGVTRVPALPHDWNTRPTPATTHLPSSAANKSDPPGRHVSVLIRNHVYSLQVIEPTEGKIMRPEAIEEGLRAIVEDVKGRDDAHGISALTSDERDTWAQTREYLLSLSPVNVDSVRSIESSLLALTLDTSVLPLPADYPEPPSKASSLWVDALSRNVSGAGRGGHNRWFDKSLHLVVEPNGRAGLNGEHSPVDALIPSILADYATAVPCPPLGKPYPYDKIVEVGGLTEAEMSEAKASFERKDFIVDPKLKEEIKKSTQRALALAADSDIRVLWYDEYGADWIKKVGKQSPDAYLQQALQVAMALSSGEASPDGKGAWQTPTYETASTRLFRNGRTDVIRTFSTESYHFVKALVRDRLDEQGDAAAKKQNMQQLYKLLSAATKAHNAQTRESSMGKGIDRHLTGLRLVYNPATDEALGGMPQLFQDPIFAQSQTWTLSTSGLSAGDRLAGTGFGAGYPDGYGCNYLAGGHLLKFGLESKHSHPDTSTTKFATNLVKALRLMREICEQGAPPAEEGSKL